MCDQVGQVDVRRPTVVVVVPVHDNVATLDRLHDGLTRALAELDASSSILYVDDASTDGSWHWIQERATADGVFRGIRLARNVGQTRAICVGFEEASAADVIATIDADLDFDPAELPRFVDAVLAGADLAAGIRVDRTDPLIHRLLPSRAFNLALRMTAGYREGDAGCGYFAMSGALARRLPSVGHRRLAIRPALDRLADSVTAVPVHYRSRPGSGISARRRLSIATEVLAVEPRPGLILAGIAGVAGARAGRGRPAWALPAAGAGVVATVLLARHRSLRRSACGALGDVAERVGQDTLAVEAGSGSSAASPPASVTST